MRDMREKKKSDAPSREMTVHRSFTVMSDMGKYEVLNDIVKLC